MLLDDLLDVAWSHAGVPHGLRVDDDRHAALALIETARLVGPHAPLQTALVQAHLEKLGDELGPLLRAAALRISRLAPVDAGEDVALVSGHGTLNVSPSRG